MTWMRRFHNNSPFWAQHRGECNVTVVQEIETFHATFYIFARFLLRQRIKHFLFDARIFYCRISIKIWKRISEIRIKYLIMLNSESNKHLQLSAINSTIICSKASNECSDVTTLLRIIYFSECYFYKKIYLHCFVLFTLLSLFRMAFLDAIWMNFCKIFILVWWKSYRNTICGLRIAIYTDIPVYCCSPNN